MHPQHFSKDLWFDLKKKRQAQIIPYLYLRKKNPQQKTSGQRIWEPKGSTKSASLLRASWAGPYLRPLQAFSNQCQDMLQSFCHSICPSSHESSPLPPGFFQQGKTPPISCFRLLLTWCLPKTEQQQSRRYHGDDFDFGHLLIVLQIILHMEVHFTQNTKGLP